MTDVQNPQTPGQPPVPAAPSSLEPAPPSGTALKKIIIVVGLLLLAGLLGTAIYYLPRLTATKKTPVAPVVQTNPPVVPTPPVVVAPEATSTPAEVATTTEPVATSTPVELPPGNIAFGQTVQLFAGDEVTLGDATRSYRVKAMEFTDSRCPEGVQCIWAGERGVRLEITNLLNDKKEDMKLGMVTAKTLEIMGLKGTLIEINDEKGGPYARVKFD